MISKFVRCVLWPRLRSILVTLLCELGKNVYSAVVVWNNLLMCIINYWSVVLLGSPMSLLIFCPWDLSISEREVLKFPTTIMDASISLYRSICFCLVLRFNHEKIVMSSWVIDAFIIMWYPSLSLIIFLTLEFSLNLYTCFSFLWLMLPLNKIYNDIFVKW